MLVPAHGLDACFFNIEFFVPADGPAQIVELNPRIASQFSPLVEAVHGRSTYDALFALACGEDPAWDGSSAERRRDLLRRARLRGRGRRGGARAAGRPGDPRPSRAQAVRAGHERHGELPARDLHRVGGDAGGCASAMPGARAVASLRARRGSPRPLTSAPANASPAATHIAAWNASAASASSDGASLARARTDLPRRAVDERDDDAERGDGHQLSEARHRRVDAGGDAGQALRSRLQCGGGDGRHRRGKADGEDEQRREDVDPVARLPARGGRARPDRRAISAGPADEKRTRSETVGTSGRSGRRGPRARC